ncbi:MAG: PASTA domain-containing protein [Thermoanaerobacterales bacterium]|nr:PASTA domain-containing protein [Bacillota bacterium]MDI6907797.1 PASTA domain-containing protein [Thermoanaerobacterales bacterium]
MDCPDVLGLELAEARELLQAAGFTVRVVATGPPRGGVGGPERVLRVARTEADVVELVAAPQGWEEHNGRPVQSAG